jgi:drug/metabolite transporter (DMT)-like permease
MSETPTIKTSAAMAESASSAAHIRPLDPLAAVIVTVLCLSWGLNQVAIKLAIHDIPPLVQALVRSLGAAIIVFAWMRWRKLPIFAHDGSLQTGLLCGVFFGLEFICIYHALNYTTATRAILFLYLAPFFVVVGIRWVMPADRFSSRQWIGLILSFAGMLLAFGVPTPALDPRQIVGDLLSVAAALFWAMTTLLVKASRMSRISAEKMMMYQLAVSVPMLIGASWLVGERMDLTTVPSAVALASVAYQTLYIVPVTYVIWFALIVRYSASRLSAFSFLTPLFGVAAGYLVLGDPLTPAFALAVLLVMAGLALVNRRG